MTTSVAKEDLGIFLDQASGDHFTYSTVPIRAPVK